MENKENAIQTGDAECVNEWNDSGLDFEARERKQEEDTEFLTLTLPRAHTWHTGMEIKDERSVVRFVVLETEVSKVMFGGRPTFCTVLGDQEGNPQAVVQGETGFLRDRCFSIYTSTPSYEGQEPAVHLADVCVKETDMYLYGEAHLDRVLRCTAKGELVAILEPKISRRRLATSKREIEFYLVGLDDWRMVKRDQFSDSLIVAPGASLLLATCLAFAFDRMVKPFGGKIDQEESLENSATFDALDSLNQCTQGGSSRDFSAEQ